MKAFIIFSGLGIVALIVVIAIIPSVCQQPAPVNNSSLFGNIFPTNNPNPTFTITPVPGSEYGVFLGCELDTCKLGIVGQGDTPFEVQQNFDYLVSQIRADERLRFIRSEVILSSAGYPTHWVIYYKIVE
jgi:hypothetical protein